MNNKHSKYQRVAEVGRKASENLSMYGTFEIYVLMGHVKEGVFEPILESDYFSSHGSHRKAARQVTRDSFYFENRNRERKAHAPSYVVFGYYDTFKEDFIVVAECDLDEQMTDDQFFDILKVNTDLTYCENYYHKDLLAANIRYQDEHSSYLYPFLEKFNFTMSEYFHELWNATLEAGEGIEEGFNAAYQAYRKFFKSEDDAARYYFEFHNWMRVHGLIELFVYDDVNRYNFNLDELPKDLMERKSEYKIDIQPSERLRTIIEKSKIA